MHPLCNMSLCFALGAFAIHNWAGNKEIYLGFKSKIGSLCFLSGKNTFHLVLLLFHSKRLFHLNPEFALIEEEEHLKSTK